MKQEVKEEVKQGLMDSMKSELTDKSWDTSSWDNYSWGKSSWGQQSWKPQWTHGGNKWHKHPWHHQKWSDGGHDTAHRGFPDANIVKFSFTLGPGFHEGLYRGIAPSLVNPMALQLHDSVPAHLRSASSSSTRAPSSSSVQFPWKSLAETTPDPDDNRVVFPDSI